jgi:vacuolar-type H+-ATPase subunit H
MGDGRRAEVFCDAPVTMAVRGVRATPAVQGPLGPLTGLLERLRRTGGVPAAAGDDLGAELAPVFAALDELERRAAAVRSASEAGRAHLEAETGEEIERIMAEARARADAERDEALRAGLRAADAEAAAIVRQGELEAERIRDVGATRVPDVAAAAVERILEGEA